MTQRDDFLGGLKFDGPRDAQVGPQTGIVRYYPVGPPPEPRASPWWRLLGAVAGAAGVVVAAFAWGHGLDRLVDDRARGLVLLGLAGLVVGLVISGRLSPAAPLAAGSVAVAAAVAYELGALPVFPVLKAVFDSGVPIGAGVLLIVLGLRRQ
ncbi:hypothetical protein [Saccharothrix algeriensis]|uniref:Drug/metabolite transporter (DMT)-like permease n=1 Tax=Saccharothrix algeriensis TaxID=173560 RepID=A0A8T8HRF0_9PSEU|nr:hypothetical protein [Saccharothrix algeriensis]MBM7812292.1 drug/metabolite transporter (DMT)-like permease [Saccharothrix algeriensis]QTR01076.1 hypothetical protein J7S33_16240 [Saccharothrix algeriensis]